MQYRRQLLEALLHFKKVYENLKQGRYRRQSCLQQPTNAVHFLRQENMAYDRYIFQNLFESVTMLGSNHGLEDSQCVLVSH